MRLIDADKLKRKAQKVATEAWKMRLTAPIETVLNQFIDWIDEQPTIESEQQWVPITEETIIQAGYEGKEVRFQHRGRLFAIRELAQ